MVQISAHCDHSADAKPISYESYLAALISGAEYAEFDICKTADNVLVVHHDARAGRRRAELGLDVPARLGESAASPF